MHPRAAKKKRGEEIPAPVASWKAEPRWPYSKKRKKEENIGNGKGNFGT
jgi:hypothetical protein